MRPRLLLSSLVAVLAIAPLDVARGATQSLAQTPNARPGRPRVQAQPPRRTPEQIRRQREENALYNQGQRALDNGRWDQAAQLFSRLATLNGTRADGALYWMAYAQNRLGRRTEALQTIAELQKTYPDSRYTTQGRALEVEVRRDAGQAVQPEVQSDQELKLMALQALQRSDPERAISMLEGIVRGTAPPRLKIRALFLLAQSDTPQARQVMADVARGNASPELQERAIGYLGIQGTPETRTLLSDIYSASTNVTVRRRVLRAFTLAGDAESLVALARRETDPMMKREMVEKLSLMRNKVALDYLADLAR